MGILSIAVSKAGGAKIDVETDDLPAEMYALAMTEGLKVILNKRMSKITIKDLEGEKLEEAHAAALKIATENHAALMKGETKSRGATNTGSGKVPGVVMVEARRLAKEVVKDEIKAAGMKVSHVEAAVITKAANALIAQDPAYIEQAKRNIEARSAKPSTLDIKSLIVESPKLVAKAEAAKAAKRKPSAAAIHAGKVAPRKGTNPQQMH